MDGLEKLRFVNKNRLPKKRKRETTKVQPSDKDAYSCKCGMASTGWDTIFRHIRACRNPSKEMYRCKCEAFFSTEAKESFLKHLEGCVLRKGHRPWSSGRKVPIISEPEATSLNDPIDKAHNDKAPQIPIQHLRGLSDPLWSAESSTRSWIEELEVAGFSNGTNQCTIKTSENSLSPTSLASGNSPTEEHSIATDSDLLSISDTSDPGIRFDIGPLSPLQRYMLDFILKDYCKTTTGHEGGNGHATPTASASSFSPGNPSQKSSNKRKFNNPGSPVESGDGPSTKFTKRTQQSGIRSKVLACPFWKRDSEKYRHCCKFTLRRIRDVKQHLNRNHIPKYCERCLETFEDEDRLGIHVRSVVACLPATGSQLEGISHMQERALQRKSDRKLGEEEQWFVIWNVLFPGTARPASAYVDSELSHDLNSFQEYWTNRGQDILLNELSQNDVWSLSSEEREAQGRQILARGLNMIYEQWTDLRRISAITIPSQSTAVSPPSTSSNFTLLPSTTSSSDTSAPDTRYIVPASIMLPDQSIASSTISLTTQVEEVNLRQEPSQLPSHILPTDITADWSFLPGESLGNPPALGGEHTDIDQTMLAEILATGGTLNMNSEFAEADESDGRL